MLLEQYWGSTGMGLTVGRVPIGSSDFSLGPWTYDDESGTGEDLNLTWFSIAYDEVLKIPLIKKAMALASLNELPLKFFGSPWAPPAWMTETNSTIHNPTLKGAPEHGIDFWGLTAQNEPAGNTGAWQDLKFTAAQQRDFIREVLGPALKASNATKDIDLMI
eukprot:gene31608-32016_t